MSIYHDYAPFYDGSGQIRFAVLIGQYLRELLERHPISGRWALDLACGTGTLALILSDDGWQVIGLDRSAAMLAIARDRAADAGPAIDFVEGDMRELNAKCGMQNVEGSADNSAFCIPHFAFSAFGLVRCQLLQPSLRRLRAPVVHKHAVVPPADLEVALLQIANVGRVDHWSP